MQEDFKLYNDSPDLAAYVQVRCQHAGGSAQYGESRFPPCALVKGLSGGSERFVCFEEVESLSLNTRLAYSPVFLYKDPNTPTPTPERQ